VKFDARRIVTGSKLPTYLLFMEFSLSSPGLISSNPKPSTCFGPVVLVRAVFGGNPGPWIAGTGFASIPEPNGKNDE
jgi:hypothetical protein